VPSLLHGRRGVVCFGRTAAEGRREDRGSSEANLVGWFAFAHSLLLVNYMQGNSTARRWLLWAS
jgi:hypothetical protein